MTADKDRSLLHFSFETLPSQHLAQKEGGQGEEGGEGGVTRPFGFTYHILPSLQGTKALRDFL